MVSCIPISTRIIVFYLIVTIPILTSCSLFVSSTSPLIITATDNTADVSVDGIYVGRGTVTTNVRRNESHTIMGKTKDGRVGASGHWNKNIYDGYT